MNFTPKGERVLIELQQESVGGIYIPDEIRMQDMPQRKGEVVALPKDEAIASELKVKDIVLFENIGIDMVLDGKDYKLVHICYLHCVIY